MNLTRCLSFALFAGAVSASAQLASCPRLAIGADVSFLPQAEQDGTVFRDAGTPAPGLEILHNHGYGWVRLRLFNDPKTLPNDLEYTLAEAKKAKALGMGFLLDFHYSDDWADPAHQVTPVAWQKLKHPQLVEAVFTYTRDTMAPSARPAYCPTWCRSATRSPPACSGPTASFPTTGTTSPTCFRRRHPWRARRQRPGKTARHHDPHRQGRQPGDHQVVLLPHPRGGRAVRCHRPVAITRGGRAASTI